MRPPPLVSADKPKKLSGEPDKEASQQLKL